MERREAVARCGVAARVRKLTSQIFHQSDTTVVT
jgi:hypothetical protein